MTTAPGSAATDLVPVLEVGGTHVIAALIDRSGPDPRIVQEERFDLDSAGTAHEIVRTLAAAARTVAVPRGSTWGVAIPGPFDYDTGIARFTGVGKFDSLDGVDLGAALAAEIDEVAGEFVFVNDAVAYGLGEYTSGSARGYRRVVCLTLGTGIGSAFLADGDPVDSGDRVPPHGYAYRVPWQGRPLEETVSRRAIRRRYAELTGTEDLVDVRDIADRAREGRAEARAAVDSAFGALGEAMAPWIERFAADVLVIGGSMSASMDLIDAPLRRGLARGVPSLADLAVTRAEHVADAPLFGAASWAVGRDSA